MQQDQGPEMRSDEHLHHSRRRQGVLGGLFFGTLLVLVGALALLTATGVLGGWVWGVFWPLVIIALGVAIVVSRLR